MEGRNLKTMDDAELLSLSRSKPAAFEEIVNRYQRAFIRKASSILRSEDDAHDAVQESFVRIYMASGRFAKREGASFSSWAYTILINQCYTAYKKKHRHEMVSLEAVAELAEIVPDKAAMSELEAAQTRDYLVSMISKLPAILRRVTELHFIDGLPQKEVAEREGVSNAVVRTRIHRAKEELRRISADLAYVPVRSYSNVE